MPVGEHTSSLRRRFPFQEDGTIDRLMDHGILNVCARLLAAKSCNRQSLIGFIIGTTSSHVGIIAIYRLPESRIMFAIANVLAESTVFCHLQDFLSPTHTQHPWFVHQKTIQIPLTTDQHQRCHRCSQVISHVVQSWHEVVPAALIIRINRLEPVRCWKSEGPWMTRH